MFHHYGDYMVGMHACGWIFWIVAIAAVLLGGWGRSGRSRGREHETSHDVLRRRLATGEITPEEYDQTKALLDRDT